MIDDATRSAVEAAIGYRFADRSLIELALVHASLVETRLNSNERMEFLGDAVLGLVACRRIFNKFPGYLEGDMTKVKSTAVSRQTCAMIARTVGLERFVLLGKGMKSAAEIPQSLIAGTLEAVIAAIYLDGGYDAAEAFILPLLEPLLDEAAASGHQQNFKSVLQQHAQQALGQTPAYRTLDEQGPDHAKCFKVAVELGARRFESAWAQSRKRAEQMAALAALRELGLIEDTQQGDVRMRANGAGETGDGAPAAPAPAKPKKKAKRKTKVEKSVSKPRATDAALVDTATGEAASDED
jgi:ribonuclease III